MMARNDHDFGSSALRSEAFAEDLDGLVASAPMPAPPPPGALRRQPSQAMLLTLLPPVIALLAIGLAVLPVLA
jgi:hypothetical protein